MLQPILNVLPKKIVCKICDYSCCKKNDMTKHLNSIKHINNTSGEKCNITEKTCNTSGEKCNTHESTLIKPSMVCDLCEKVYKSRVGLWRHKKTCGLEIKVKSEDNKSENNITFTITEIKRPIVENNLMSMFFNEHSETQENIEDFKKLILEVLKNNNELQKQNTDMQKQNTDMHNVFQQQQAEFQKQMLEVCKNSNNTIHNNSHNNNKTFNLQIFLNEECKDAMNMSEFIDSFDLQLSDLESVGELGYVEGMTKIFIDKLNSMDVCKRPMHCSDARREIIYIKDENRWEREKPSNPTLRKAVKRITFKNMRLTNLWSDTHPESKCNESRMNDVYIKLVIQSTGGSGEISDSEDKIIRRIVKGIVIDKSLL